MEIDDSYIPYLGDTLKIGNISGFLCLWNLNRAGLCYGSSDKHMKFFRKHAEDILKAPPARIVITEKIKTFIYKQPFDE